VGFGTFRDSHNRMHFLVFLKFKGKGGRHPPNKNKLRCNISERRVNE